MLDLWYKNAVFYCLDVDSFRDSNGDGVGDFQGLTERLDYIEGLGATCVWLLPFYPTPNRDNGYDITDFYGVDPRLGTLGDFVKFTRAARDHGLRVIIDLVVNHTSIDHPWFQAARADPKSPYRDWYVWSKEEPADAREGMVFPGVQESTWTWDDLAGEWYYHRFYAHQADLNVENPAVREEIEKIIGFWLELGVSGFRIDAVPFLIEYRENPPPGREDPHIYLTELRDFIAWRKAEGILLAEANITMDQVDEFFGDGDRMHLIFNFMLNQHLFLALARETAEPVERVLKTAPPIPPTAQWASFLRNHDEIDLGRLKEKERAEVFAAFGPDPSMQIYGRGIRRRLAPMLGGDEARLKLAFSAMFAMPGTPVIWYGDEIGMGDVQALKEREPVRTPMQWSEEPNAGFSSAPPEKLVRPIPVDGPFDYRKVNVTGQRDRAGSLLEHVQRLIRARRSCPEVGWGECRVVDVGGPNVLALAYDWRGRSVLTLHNFGRDSAKVRLDGEFRGCKLSPMLGRAEHRTLDAGAEIELEGNGFRWFHLHRAEHPAEDPGRGE